MAITRTGSITVISTDSQTGSQSITVPSDANIMIVKVAGFFQYSQAGEGTHTINSQSMTVIFGYGVGDYTDIFYKTNPSTGSQTYEWDLVSPPQSTALLEISFYKGVDTADPIGDTALSAYSATPDTRDTGEMTAASGDCVVVVALAYGDGSPLPSGVDWTNATELSDNTYSLGAYSGAEAFPSGNVTITATQNGGQTGFNYIQLAAATLQQSSGTAGSPYYAYAQQ